MAQPKCPFCLNKHDFAATKNMCPVHNIEIPRRYIIEYNRVPPLWLVTVGFERHGKTCYLNALTLTLENIGKIWYSTSQSYLDAYTYNKVMEMRNQARIGKLPCKTLRSRILRPMLIHMYDVPDVGSNCLVLYDTAGEYFESLEKLDEGYLRSLKEVKNIWFLIALKDLEKSDRRLFDLLNIYLSGMQDLDWQLSERNLIVVFTKADQVKDRLPQRVQDYLSNDPFQNVTNIESNEMRLDVGDFSLPKYLNEMHEISQILEDYTREYVPTGSAFIQLARRHDIGLYFTVTSALGTDVIGNELPESPTRYRILDPYLWAVHLNKPSDILPIKLVLDASACSKDVYDHNITDLAERLGDLGEVETYYLGQMKRVSVPGQTPPTAPPQKCLRPQLIGPILERFAPDALVIVLTAGKIYDLDDYAISTWHDRLLLVAVGEEQYQDWRNQVIMRRNDGIDLVFDEFRRLFNA